jgi:hypothetical protein
LVPWNLHALMTGFLAFDNGFSLLTSDREISLSVRLQLINSHSLDCTRVPWESLTLMVISLALVNGSHHWSIIKWFLPCSTSTHVFTWLYLYYRVVEMKTLNIFSRIQVALEYIQFVLLHRSTLYVSWLSSNLSP